MKTEPEFYDVKFHFPYSSVLVEKISLEWVERYAGRMRRGEPFEALTEYRDYMINPALVTYVEITAHKPF